MNVSDKTTPPTVILSGPTRGLGRALFDQLVSQAFSLVSLGRDLERIEDEKKCATSPVEFVEIDLGADALALEGALVKLRLILSDNLTGPLVFISNASIIEPILQARHLTFSGLERAIRINCLAPLMISNSLAEITKAQDRPLLILDVSSGAACRPINGWQAYCSSKAACKMGLDVLAAENTHVQVVHFDPGMMDTSMQELIRLQHEEDMLDVEAFRSFREEGKLKAPIKVAAALINLMKLKLS